LINIKINRLKQSLRKCNYNNPTFNTVTFATSLKINDIYLVLLSYKYHTFTFCCVIF